MIKFITYSLNDTTIKHDKHLEFQKLSSYSSHGLQLYIETHGGYANVMLRNTAKLLDAYRIHITTCMPFYSTSLMS